MISTATVLIATKVGKMVTNLERLIPTMLLYTLVTWSCEITWQTKNISTIAVPLATKLGSKVTNLVGLLPIMLSILWSHGLAKSRDKLKNISTVLMATKLRRIVTNLQKPLLLMFYIFWSRGQEITWQTKNINAPQCLWVITLAVFWLTLGSFP